MRAVEISQYGAPEVLKAVARPDLVVPPIGSGEVLIRVRAAGVNRPDVLQRQGFYPVPAGGSDLPGLNWPVRLWVAIWLIPVIFLV